MVVGEEPVTLGRKDPGRRNHRCECPDAGRAWHSGGAMGQFGGKGRARGRWGDPRWESSEELV